MLCHGCCLGYHRKCLPSNLEKLNNRFFLCPTHNKKVLSSIPNVNNIETPQVAREETGLGKFSFKLSGNANGFKINLGEKAVIKNGKSRIKNLKTSMTQQDLIELYSLFGLEYQKKVDFQQYQGPWCRYCGARYSPQFHDSLLGANTFCDRHHRALEKGKIDIRKLKNRKDPLKPGENKEVSYMKKVKKERSKKKLI